MIEQEQKLYEQLLSMIDCLEDNIKVSDVIYISPHKNMDFDALASAAAMCELCRKYQKRAFIVNDDITSLMPSNVRTMKNNLEKKYPFINTTILNQIRMNSLTDDEISKLSVENKNLVMSCLRIVLREKGLRFFFKYIPQADMDAICNIQKNKSDDDLLSKLIKYDSLVIDSVKEVLKGYERSQELAVMVDLNKTYLTPLESVLSTFERIIVIDHHKTDNHTILTPNMLIDTNVSSASQLAFYILQEKEIKIEPYLAHCLLAGIYLDTNRLLKKNSSEISMVCAKLMQLGADFDEVNRLFMIENFEVERMQTTMINKLLDESIFKRYDIAITFNTEEPETLYLDDSILARAADQLLQYENVAASFVLGFIDREELGLGHKDKIAIKGRSNNRIDISAIMQLFGGGGDSGRGACIIEESNIEKVKAALDYVLSQGFALVDAEGIETKVLQFVPQIKK